jgi:hypothetical protein
MFYTRASGYRTRHPKFLASFRIDVHLRKQTPDRDVVGTGMPVDPMKVVDVLSDLIMEVHHGGADGLEAYITHRKARFRDCMQISKSMALLSFRVGTLIRVFLRIAPITHSSIHSESRSDRG